jgi:hypothetical protein
MSQIVPELEQLDAAAAEPTTRAIRGRSPWELAWERLRHDRVAVGCGVVIALTGYLTTTARAHATAAAVAAPADLPAPADL